MGDITPYLVATLISVVLIILSYFKRVFNYWKSKGVYTPTPTIPFGNARDFFLKKTSMGEYIRDLHVLFKSKGLKFGGAYSVTTPDLVVTDLDLIKRVVNIDFAHFGTHGFFVDEEVDPLTGHLFNLEGAKWKSLRTKLTPTFTSGKMKMMFETFVTCTEGLKELVDDLCKTGPVDIKETMGRFTTDIIGSCAFGIECNSMKDENAEFRKYGKKIFEGMTLMFIKVFAIRFIPTYLLHMMKFKIISPNLEKFFMGVVKDTVQYREKNNIYRKDFMHLLLQLKNRGNVFDDEKILGDENAESVLTINEVAAQCFVFFAGGFETSSTALTYALYELAVNQDIQQKLREEINEVFKKHDKKLTYEAVKEMEYLDRVLKETMRLHPPVPFLPRACTKAYTIPKTDITIDPKVRVFISVLAIHMDPEYYPDPERFDPERFTEKNKAKRPHYTYMPFGEGPRMCIGMRFGVLQTKVGLITIIRNYKITLNEKTKTPLETEPLFFINATKGGIWLNVEKI